MEALEEKVNTRISRCQCDYINLHFHQQFVLIPSCCASSIFFIIKSYYVVWHTVVVCK